MSFPGIYFKPNSTEYAAMPYKTDSCYKYIVAIRGDIKSYVIWRDSSETEALTIKRIRKIKAELNRYMPSSGILLESMGVKQKINGQTIGLAENKDDLQFLLSLKSVFEVSGTKIQPPGVKKKICWHCLSRFRKCQQNRYFFAKLRGN